MRFKITINIFLFLSFNFPLRVAVKSQTVLDCDSVVNKKFWENNFAANKDLVTDFESNVSLKVFGYLINT